MPPRIRAYFTCEISDRVSCLFEAPRVAAGARGDQNFLGKFHCKLCPERVLLNEKDLEQHLASAGSPGLKRTREKT